MVVDLPAPFGEQTEDGARLGTERDAVDGDQVAIGLPKILDFDHGLGSALVLRTWGHPPPRVATAKAV
jgi:hypothetical protein